MTRLIFYTVTLSMIFHQNVLASPRASSSSFTSSNAYLAAKILSFSSNASKGKTTLNWTITNNEDADRFEVEKSADGKSFETAALVFSTNKSGTDNYQFFEKENKSKTYYYRIRIISKNGSVEYSQAIMAGPDIIK